MQTWEQYLAEDELEEGIFDEHILKAIFMGGGMGSGKSFVNTLLFNTIEHFGVGGLGLKSMSTDDIFARKVKKAGMDLKTALDYPEGRALHKASRPIKSARVHMVAQQRLGMVLDGTGQNPTKVLKRKKLLEGLGYDCFMVMVTTDLDVALERNRQRSRSAPDEIVIETHENVAAAGRVYKRTFGRNYFEIPNSRVWTKEEVKRTVIPDFYRLGMHILSKPVQNPIGRAWMEAEAETLPPHMARKIAGLHQIGRPRDPRKVRVGKYIAPED